MEKAGDEGCAKDLGYGETAGLNAILEEVSHMLNEYAAAILTSGC